MAGRSTLDPDNFPAAPRKKHLKGHDTASLGPSDSSDSGSDLARPGTDRNVGDLGILSVDVVPGDLNFEQVRQTQVTLRYEGTGLAPIEQQFTLDEDNLSHRFQHVIFQPADRPYQYRAKYFMADGKEFEAGLAELKVLVPVSVLAKWKTTFQLVALGALILGGAFPAQLWIHMVGVFSLWAAAALTLLTGWDYLRVGLKHMD